MDRKVGFMGHLPVLDCTQLISQLTSFVPSPTRVCAEPEAREAQLTWSAHDFLGKLLHRQGSDADLPERQKEIVDKHNDLRRKVEPKASNMLKTEWNGTAAKNAKSWADECDYNHSPTSRRTIENGLICGENLFYSSVPKSWSEAIQAWFDEKADYIYGTGPKTENAVIGHYTQLIWYKSFLIACAVARCQHDLYKYFYVCHYSALLELSPRETRYGESY
ncbi:UNVERIFIED_CONTAM: hypothetical protein K2H54_038869 [Gekko kuhli]